MHPPPSTFTNLPLTSTHLSLLSIYLHLTPPTSNYLHLRPTLKWTRRKEMSRKSVSGVTGRWVEVAGRWVELSGGEWKMGVRGDEWKVSGVGGRWVEMVGSGWKVRGGKWRRVEVFAWLSMIHSRAIVKFSSE